MNSAGLAVAMLALMAGQGLAATVEEATITGHNTIRRTEAKTESASNLYELVWDLQLARGAQAWAEKCEFNHQHISGEGENLYYASPKTHPDDYYIERALASWMREKALNNGSFDCCFHGGGCCHYTQVVAARSRSVGCGVATCAELHQTGRVISHNAAYVVCDYSPMGNLHTPTSHAAYAHGAPCSACDAGDTCNDGLCVNSA